jgi:hypothetical protein
VALLEERQQFWTSTTLLSQLAPLFRFPSWMRSLSRGDFHILSC